jgi:ATP-dependent Zn protease
MATSPPTAGVYTARLRPHEEVTSVLRDHRDQLDARAKALVQNETLDKADAYAAAGIA